MTDWEDDEEVLVNRRLCSRCVGESYLHAEIERNGEKCECEYCCKLGATLSIGEIADHVDGAFERHYVVTPNEASPLEYTMMKDGDYSWERQGEPAIYAVASAAEIDEGPSSGNLGQTTV